MTIDTDAKSGKKVETANLPAGIYRATFMIPAVGDVPEVKATRLVEVIDPDTHAPCPDGESGNLCVTALYKDGVYPIVRAWGSPRKESAYTTLLMSTGLTFGTISALFGLSHGVIDQAQYSYLVAAVIGSASIVPFLTERNRMQEPVRQQRQDRQRSCRIQFKLLD